MKSLRAAGLLLIFVSMLTSCELIGDIFGAGFYTGIFVVVFVIVVIVVVITRIKRN